LIINLLRKIRV